MNPNNNDEIKLEEIELKEKTKKLDINKLTFPVVNVRRTSYLSESTTNYFFLGIGFFIYGLNDLKPKWFTIENENFISGYYLFVCAVLYLTSLYDWYQGHTISFTLNFLLGSIFLNFINYSEGKAEGVFYIIIFAYLVFIDLCMKDKGILYLVDYIILFLGMVFQFAVTYWSWSTKINFVRKIRNYIFMIKGAFFWITGIIKLFFDLSALPNNLVEPSI